MTAPVGKHRGCGRLPLGTDGEIAFRNSGKHLNIMGAGSLAGPNGRQALARDPFPTQAKMCGHVRRGRPTQLRGHVVPPDSIPQRMLIRIEAIAPQIRVVDPTNKCDLVIDDEDLLVMSMEGALTVIKQAMHACPSHELIAGAFDPGAPDGGPRDRGTRPKQHPDVDAGGELGQQFADRRAVP